MVGRCVVPGCNNSGHHKIPNQKNLRTLWIEAMKIDITHLKIKRPLVCPLHFKDTDYNYLDLNPEHAKRRYLKKHAVPSIFEWNEEPQNELCKFTFQEEISQSLSDSDPEMGNEELGDPLLKSTDDGSSITEKLSSQISRSSSDIQNLTRENEFYTSRKATIPSQEILIKTPKRVVIECQEKAVKRKGLEMGSGSTKKNCRPAHSKIQQSKKVISRKLIKSSTAEHLKKLYFKKKCQNADLEKKKIMLEILHLKKEHDLRMQLLKKKLISLSKD